DRQPRVSRRRWRRRAEPGRADLVRRPRRQPARRRPRQEGQVRAPGPGPARPALRPGAGSAPAGPDPGRARAAGHRPAGGGGARVRCEEGRGRAVPGRQAVVDRDVALHHGVDLSGVLRAAWVNLRSGEARQGGSTLTQQLARSGTLGIGREQTYTREFNEILLALLIEARYDKRSILEAYLNQVYLGQRGSQE